MDRILSLHIYIYCINAIVLLLLLSASFFREIDVLMPGYTHLQRAQPIRWSHWLLR